MTLRSSRLVLRCAGGATRRGMIKRPKGVEAPTFLGQQGKQNKDDVRNANKSYCPDRA
jgi:hypothetical protein